MGKSRCVCILLPDLLDSVWLVGITINNHHYYFKHNSFFIHQFSPAGLFGSQLKCIIPQTHIELSCFTEINQSPVQDDTWGAFSLNLNELKSLIKSMVEILWRDMFSQLGWTLMHKRKVWLSWKCRLLGHKVLEHIPSAASVTVADCFTLP